MPGFWAYLKNTGTGTLDLTGLSIPLPFTLASANLPATLAAGGSTSFTVGLSATASGTYTRKISISNNDSDESPYDFDVKAVVGGTPEIEITGNAYTILNGDTTPGVFDGTDFGTMDLNTPMSRVFTVKNSGTGTLNLTGLSIPLPFTLTSGNLPPTLAAGGSASFTVGFSATASGIFTRKISIANNDSNENPYDFDIKAVVGTPEIEVRGLGLVIPDDDTTPTTLDGTDFGTVSVNTSDSRTFTVTNTGNGTLKLTGLTIPSPFTLSSANLPPTLAAGGSVSFIVGFLPTVSGSYTRKISIANDDSNESPYDFDIKAIATSPPEINVTGLGVSIPDGDNTPSTLDGTDFGSVAPNVIMTRTFTVTNSGAGSLSLGTPLMAGGFSMGSDSLVSTLGPGMSDTFSVNFSSATSGTFTSTVTINNNDSDEAPYDFSVKAFIGPEIDVKGNGQSIADGDNTPSISDGTDFGSILAGTSVSRTFTVLNTGTNWLYLGTPSITGGFTLGSDTLVTSLGPGTSDTFSVNFMSLTATTFNGQVTIANNDNDESPYNFALKAIVTGNPEINVLGNGVVIIDGDSTPNTTDDTDFGNVVPGATTTRTFTVQNTGNATLFLGGVYPTGGFSLGSNPLVSSLVPGASDTFSVNFSSSVAGTYTGQVSFSNNDSDESPYNFALKAVVIAPEINLLGYSPQGSLASIANNDLEPGVDDGTDFGTVLPGTTVTRLFTVENQGSGWLYLGTPVVTGVAFQLVSNYIVSPLAPYSSASFVVRFLSSVTGPFTGQISIGNSDSDESTYVFAVKALVAVPEVTITATDQNASEASADTGTYTISRSGDSSGTLTVNFNVTGTATSGTDFTALGTSVTFAAGQTTKTLTLTPIDDSLDEVEETAIVTLATGSGYTIGSPNSAVVTIADDDPAVNLTIFNGQDGPEIPEAKEETQGAFTVANLNDTDGDGVIDNQDQTVMANGAGTTNEVDLMKLVISKPANAPAGSTMTLTVVSGSIALWQFPSKVTALPWSGGYTIAVDTIPATGKIIWVEATAASSALRAIVLKLTYSAAPGVEDIVKATGIWATQTNFITSQAETNTVTGSTGNELKVASAAGFSTGNWVYVFSNGSWFRSVIVAVQPTTNTIVISDFVPPAMPADKIVRQGYPEEVDDFNMLTRFGQRGKVPPADNEDGAVLGKSDFYNSMVMEMTMTPVGIGKVIKDGGTGIVVDITRQMQSRVWTLPGGLVSKDFPLGDIANDDSLGVPDEDVDFFVKAGVVKDRIYVRDMPGEPTRTAGLPFGTTPRKVIRHNMLEFVRIKFNGTAFTTGNDAEAAEGSRASAKISWHSQIDVVNDFSDPGGESGKWIRNTAAGTLNDIDLGAINIDASLPQ